jgi:hypothetical protein
MTTILVLEDDLNRALPPGDCGSRGTDPMPVTGLAANFSPMPRIAPPPLGRESVGGDSTFAACGAVEPSREPALLVSFRIVLGEALYQKTSSPLLSNSVVEFGRRVQACGASSR